MKRTRLCDVPGWLDVIRQKPKGELLLVLYEREKHTAEQVALVEEVLRTRYGLSEEQLHAESLFVLPKPKAKGSRDLLIEVLEEMGVWWSYGYNYLGNDDDEDDATQDIEFSYQGEDFRIQADNECQYICITLSVGYIEMNVPERTARWRKAINELNATGFGNFAFNIYEWVRGNGMSVSHLTSCWFVPQIPNLMFYFHETLRSMIAAKLEYLKTVEQLRLGRLSNCRKRPKDAMPSHVKGSQTGNISCPKSVFNMGKKKTKGTRNLFVTTLAEWGCPYTYDEDDVICFRYQGEEFWASVSEDSSYVSLYDFDWYAVELSDLDEVSRMRQAINEVNWRGNVSVYYLIDNEENKMYVRSKSVFVFDAKLGDLSRHLSVEVNEFFRARHLLGAELEQLRAKER